MDHIGGAQRDERPGEEEVEAAARRQVLIARDGHPARKGAAFDDAGLAPGEAQHACGCQFQAADAGHAPRAAVRGRLRQDFDKGLVGVGPVSPPVQARIGVEDLQAAGQQHCQAEQVQPMPDPGEDPVAVDAADRLAAHRRRSFGIRTC